MFARSSGISRVVAVACLLLGLSAVGCGGGLAPVTGKVSYKGKALSGGSIQFLGSDGAAYPAEIGSDGTYSVKVRTGEAKVLVTANNDAAMVEHVTRLSHAGQSGKGGSLGGPRNFSLIPTRYGSWETSGLSRSIKSGKNTLDFDLTD